MTQPFWPLPSVTSTSSSLPWDSGVTWFSLRTVAPTDLPVEVAYVRDQVLRVASGNAEDAHIERLIKAAVDECEHMTGAALMPQTWQMVLSGFPSGRIVLPRPPLIAPVSFEYVDADGVTQSLAVSPAEFATVPSGKVTKAEVRPLSGSDWPTAQTRGDAVTITYTAGYSDVEDIPERYITGICLMVAELYKQRSLSVQNTIQNVPAVLQLERFWQPRY